MDDKTVARMEALDRAVRVSLANGGHEKTEDTVKRAEEFHYFLTGHERYGDVRARRVLILAIDEADAQRFIDTRDIVGAESANWMTPETFARDGSAPHVVTIPTPAAELDRLFPTCVERLARTQRLEPAPVPIPTYSTEK